ncbi:MAG: hypothetical protein AAAFM81_07305 [Pseudomonadota bacterium]
MAPHAFTRLRHKMLVLATCALGLAGTATASQLDFPGETPSENALSAQVKAERAYDAGDYKAAFWYYRKELAPIGDKYAQYMVGYMLENGLGTQRNPIEAAAWFELAAERGHEQLVDAHRTFRASLSESQRDSIEATLTDLKFEYSDRSLLERLIRRDLKRLSEMTGSRSGKCVGAQSLRVYAARDSYGDGSMSGERYCRTLNKRIERRMEYIGGYVEFGDLELLPDEDEETNDTTTE